ncbi:MAG: hypothetical protein FWD48_01075 [Oscillospiraceae bacterium]|nr:hypothetical protein [Oscillospiraceae bacterium]
MSHKTEKLESYIEWIEIKGAKGFDKDECLSYLRDALLTERCFEELENRLEKAVELPFKIGTTIYLIRPADCQNNCPHIDSDICKYSRYSMPTEEIIACQEAHAVVEEIVVDMIEVCEADEAVYDTGNRVTVNDFYEIASSESVYFTREEAEKALKERNDEHNQD